VNDERESREPPPVGEVSHLVILALLAKGPIHGYQVRQAIERANMERWADVKYGSIYAGLRRLEAARLVERAEVTRQGARPPRTVYRITAAGRQQLEALLRRAWSQPTWSKHPVDVALVFADLLPGERIDELLEQRVCQLDALAEGLRERQAALRATVGLPPNLRDLFDHSQRLLAAERDWCRHVQRQALAGTYRPAGEVPAGPPTRASPTGA
jgi:DNA-binding PadR family transcriptional regulator